MDSSTICHQNYHRFERVHEGTAIKSITDLDTETRIELNPALVKDWSHNLPRSQCVRIQDVLFAYRKVNEPVPITFVVTLLDDTIEVITVVLAPVKSTWTLPEKN